MTNLPRPSSPSNRGNRRRLLALGILLGVAITILVAIPYGIRWQAVTWLRAHGHPAARLDDVDFNPFRGRLALRALGGGTGEGEQLALADAAVEVDWLPLLGHRLRVPDVAIQGMALDLHRRADGAVVVGRVEFPAPSQAEPSRPAGDTRPWLIGVGKVDLRDVLIRYSDPLVETTVRVKELHLDPALQWEPDRATAFRAEFELDGEHWTLEGTAKPFAQAPSVDVKVALQGQVQRRYPRLLARLGVESLSLGADTEVHLQARYAPDTGEIEVRHQGRVSLRQVSVATAQAAGELANLDWEGVLSVAGTTAAPRIDVDGTLSLAGVQLALPDRGARGGVETLTLAVKALQLTHTSDPSRLDVGGAVELTIAGLHGEHDRGQGSLGTLGWRGNTRLNGPPSALAAAADGTLEISDLTVANDSGLQAHQETARWQGEIHYGTGNGDRAPGLELTGSFGLRGTRASGIEGPLADLGLGELELELAPLQVSLPVDAPPTLVHRGSLRIDAAEGALTAPPLRVSQTHLEWKGGLRFAPADGITPPGVALDGALATEGLALTNRETGLDLLALDRLDVTGVSATALDRATVGAIRLGGLRALENAEGTGGQVLSLARCAVDRVSLLGADRLEVGALRLADLEVQVTRDAAGELAFRQSLPPAPTAPAADPQTAPGGTGPAGMAVQLGEAHLVGENRLAYRDHTVEPPYAFEITPFEVHLEGVDSRDPAGLSPLSVRARSGTYATLQVDGKVGLFAARPTLHLTGEVRGIDLAQATTLAQRHTGYRIRSGLLDADLRVDADQGILDSLTELTANKLEMVKLDPEQLDQLDQQLGLPLNSALNLLRDSDDNIQLKIPVQGDLSSPDIDIGDAVRKALLAGTTKAVSTGALTYLASLGSAVFLPVGAAVAAGKVISLATALRFEPILFPAAEHQLDSETGEQLGTLATLLAERPNLRITLCPLATPEDRRRLQEQALAQQPPPPPAPVTAGTTPPVAPQPPAPPEIPAEKLLELATRRGEGVKHYLVEERGISPGRLLVCSPELDEAEAAAPRVEVSL